RKGEAYITTQQDGLYFSSNIEATTPVLTVLDQYPFRAPNRVYFNPYNTNDVWVNSFGNGLQMGTFVTTDTKEVKELSGATIYPNPNTGSFSLVLKNAPNDKTILEVYNMLGEKIYSTGVSFFRTEINLGTQPSGVYIYKVINENTGLIGEGKILIQ
ncbi:MAG TPA: T9SS type A sorting domain-containing protein, partial [Bacteroidia bacterium]|nr:T9SS type A sorting domain-containing protein [Bacteroidia bacterium]